MKTTKEILTTMRSNNLLDDAYALMAAGKYFDALHCVNTYLLLHESDVKALLLKGLCYLYTDQSAKARYMFDMAKENYPDHADVYYCYAEYYKLELNYTVAAQYINAAMACGPENATYLRFAAELCYLQGEYQQAYQLINSAIIVNPFREDVYYWRALVLMRLQKHEVALNDINRALSLNQSYVDAYRLRARLHMQLGDTDAGLADIKKAQRHELLLKNAQRNAA